MYVYVSISGKIRLNIDLISTHIGILYLYLRLLDIFINKDNKDVQFFPKVVPGWRPRPGGPGILAK